MNHGTPQNQCSRMRYPSVFPGTRAKLEFIRNKINDSIDEVIDSNNPFQEIIQKFSLACKNVLTQK